MTEADQPGAACIANIGGKGRRQRMTFGVVLVGVGVAVGVFLIATGASWPWRLLLFLPLWVGALGVFQAREKT